MLHLYFAGAVRGSDGVEGLSRRIRALERFGVVTTRHMAHPASVDLPGGGASNEGDAAIFAHDQQLLAKSDVFIGDLSSPSTGAGFMAARAVQLGKPTLAAYRSNEFSNASLAEGEARVAEQAKKLAAALRALGHPTEVSFSLELVHGIWTFG